MQPAQVDEQFDRYRDVRERLERSLLPLARSLDGRSFSFQAPVGAPLQVGSYARIEVAGGPVLGQIVESVFQLIDGPELERADAGADRVRTRVRIHAVQGSGVVLGDAGPFNDAAVGPASPDEVAAWLGSTASRRAQLTVGEMLFAPGVPARIDAGGFDRHTFLCGQSGSGKSYALGLILERLLLETRLQIVVLDPNSDFVRLGEARPGAPAAEAARYAERVSGVRVLRAGADEGRLELRFTDLDEAGRAAAIGLDPLRDRDEYAALLELLEQDRRGDDLEGILQSLVTGPEHLRALGKRVRNLGVLDWPVWARRRDVHGLLDELEDEDWRCLVVDLGSIDLEQERALVAQAVLARLWQGRARRRPLLVVVDEAHNVCPQEPEGPLTALSTELAVRIAGEGRKFGLHLLVSTQRPSKVHENVVSQCDNLLLMKMNGGADVARLAELFSYAPPTLIGRSPLLRQGECLAAGRLVGDPAFLRFGERLAQEGGGDVPSDWAAPRSD